MLLMRYSAATDVGLQRSNNEDSYLSCPKLGLWVVADGMGGHAAGEVASAIVAETVRNQVAEGHSLKDAIQQSHHDVLDAAANGHGGQGMGSTIVALKVLGNTYQIAWVGDSRAYLWSPKSEGKRLQQLTTDHSYVQMLYQTGAISEAELDTHPEKNIITQCLGSLELESVNVETVEGEWKNRDCFILCSDGLSDAVPSETIDSILANANNTDTAVKNLIQTALSCGGKDNITVTIVEYPGTLKNYGKIFLSLFSKTR